MDSGRRFWKRGVEISVEKFVLSIHDRGGLINLGMKLEHESSLEYRNFRVADTRFEDGKGEEA